MELGVDRFIKRPATAADSTSHVRNNPVPDVIAEAVLADSVGLDAFGIGEHHDVEFLDSAPVVILSEIAARRHTYRYQRRSRC